MKIKEALLQLGYAVDRAHKKHITYGFGQAMVYQEKADEATDYLAAGYPENISGYPLLNAEKEATGKSVIQVADGIIAKKSKWISTATKIEKIRLTAITKFKIPNANFEAELEYAKSCLDKI